ncbi:hypothetical protein KFL_002400130 [Klebsormidium nitens]|uniref:BTB domain-containing protein n=1 Tax=Klebsormidium nitens TaxID=105231 RepID=A0A1Y1I8S7_KLENI|nr:hypothetical protein KFL_002400130 [Klebsormidium nitens]|eukprot:GAQ85541.1 hypothetical protein KFL_002400130 [Klebsormidium nitens]
MDANQASNGAAESVVPPADQAPADAHQGANMNGPEEENLLDAVGDSATRDTEAEDEIDEWELGDSYRRSRRKRTPQGDVYSAARSGDVDRLKYLLHEEGVDINARDKWDSTPLYYACLAGHEDITMILLEAGAVCSEYTFDGDRCHYAALNLRIREILKAYEQRPPPLDPLQLDLRECFPPEGDPCWPPDITFSFLGSDRTVGAHRAILAARSPYFSAAFAGKWRGRDEVRLASPRLSYSALVSLFQFFYTDRLDVAVDEMEDLARICRQCRLPELREKLEAEKNHQKYSDMKWHRLHQNLQRRFVLQASSLSEPARLNACLGNILRRTGGLAATSDVITDRVGDLDFSDAATPSSSRDDFADVILATGAARKFRAHKVVLAARSEYFRARLSRTEGFKEGLVPDPDGSTLPVLTLNDVSPEALETVFEYMYTDRVTSVDPGLVVEVLDAASQFLLFPLKRAVADALLPGLEAANVDELCHWLLVADMYGVARLREFCLNAMANNFEAFASSAAFQAMVKELPPLTEFVDATIRPNKPEVAVPRGTEERNEESTNVLEDLREKWLEFEGGELEERDKHAAEFDRRMTDLRNMDPREPSDFSSAD